MTKLFSLSAFCILSLSIFGQKLSIIDSCYQQAQIDFEAHKYEMAVQNFTKVIELDSSRWLAYRQRGRAKISLDRFNEAVADFNVAIAINPCDTFSYYNRGFAKYLLQDYNNALKDYDAAIKLYPTVDYFFSRGMAHLALKKYASLIKDLDVAIALDSTNVNIGASYGSRAYAFMKLEKYKKAIANFDEAISKSLHMPNASYYYNRGYCKYNLSDYDGACKDMQLAIKMGYTGANRELLKKCGQ